MIHREVLLTRADADVGEGVFDSIAWAFSEHVKAPDNPLYNSAVLYGREDAPGMIDFYTEADPLITSHVAYRWTDQDETDEIEAELQ